MRDDGLVHVYLLLSTLFCFVNLAVTHKLYILGIDDETKQVAFSKAQLKHTFERNVFVVFPFKLPYYLYWGSNAMQQISTWC